MRRRRLTTRSLAPGSAMLLGGPWHGKIIQIPPDQGARIAIPVMRSQPSLVAASGNLPPPSYDTEYYERHEIALPCQRPLPGWEVGPADPDPPWVAHSISVVWAHSSHLPEIKRAWEVVKETVFNIVIVDPPITPYEPWGVYRAQKMFPNAEYATEASIRLVDRALDELDEALGFER